MRAISLCSRSFSSDRLVLNFCEVPLNARTRPMRRTVVGQCKKIDDTQMAHLVLPNTQADPSQNQKSYFFQRTDNDIEHLKLNLADRNNIKY